MRGRAVLTVLKSLRVESGLRSPLLSIPDAYLPVGPEGEETELTDDGPALDAIRTLLRIAERRSKLLGLDAPVKVEAEGEVHVVVRGEGVNVEDMR